MPHSTRKKPKARSNTINTVYKEAPLTGGFLISNAGGRPLHNEKGTQERPFWLFY